MTLETVDCGGKSLSKIFNRNLTPGVLVSSLVIVGRTAMTQGCYRGDPATKGSA